MRCTRCGSANREGVSFCEECGSPLAAAASPPEPPGHPCTNCGFVNRPGVSFCEECGEGLDGPAAAKEPPATPPPRAVSPETPPARRSRLPWVVAAVVVVLGGVAGLWFALAAGDDGPTAAERREVSIEVADAVIAELRPDMADAERSVEVLEDGRYLVGYSDPDESRLYPREVLVYVDPDSATVQVEEHD